MSLVVSFNQEELSFPCGKDDQKKIFYNQSQNSCQGIKEKSTDKKDQPASKKNRPSL